VLRPGLDAVSYEKRHQTSNFTGEYVIGQVVGPKNRAKKSTIFSEAADLWLIPAFTLSGSSPNVRLNPVGTKTGS